MNKRIEEHFFFKFCIWNKDHCKYLSGIPLERRWCIQQKRNIEEAEEPNGQMMVPKHEAD
jgi:hypothetical protein